MNRSSLNTAALVDLKTELLRKRELAKQLKQQRNADFEPTVFRPKNEKPKTIPKSSEHPGKILDEDDEEEKALRKSREMLEKKSLLYDKIYKGEKILDEEENERYLVDFGKKEDNAVRLALDEDREITACDLNKTYEPENEIQSSTDVNEDDWVDYIDNRGNRKRCLRDDLPLFQSVEHLQNQEKNKNSAFWENIDSKVKPAVSVRDLPEEDPEKEIGPVHYENVRYNEARSHGVGYFAFAESEDRRKEQLDSLNNLRDQTVKQREMRERMKEKRASLLAARLVKVKQRKNITLGQELKDPDSDEDLLVEDIPLPTQPFISDELIEPPKKVPAKIRPWDKGKDFIQAGFSVADNSKRSTENYFEKQRSMRESDFAPPNIYFRNKGKQKYTPKQSYAHSSENPTESKPKCAESVTGNLGQQSPNLVSEANTPTCQQQSFGLPQWPPNFSSPPGYQNTGIPFDFSVPPPGFPAMRIPFQYPNTPGIPVMNVFGQQQQEPVLKGPLTFNNQQDTEPVLKESDQSSCSQDSTRLNYSMSDQPKGNNSQHMSNEEIDNFVTQKLKFYRNKNL